MEDLSTCTYSSIEKSLDFERFFLSTKNIARWIESVDTLIESTGLIRVRDFLETRRRDPRECEGISNRSITCILEISRSENLAQDIPEESSIGCIGDEYSTRENDDEKCRSEYESPGELFPNQGQKWSFLHSEQD